MVASLLTHAGTPAFRCRASDLRFVEALRKGAAGDEPPARFTVTTRKADDTVAVAGDETRTAFDVRSPPGIGAAAITQAGDAWPKAVVVRLHLKGLENLKVSAGAVAVGAAAGSPGRHGRGPAVGAGPG